MHNLEATPNAVFFAKFTPRVFSNTASSKRRIAACDAAVDMVSCCVVALTGSCRPMWGEERNENFEVQPSRDPPDPALIAPTALLSFLVLERSPSTWLAPKTRNLKLFPSHFSPRYRRFPSPAPLNFDAFALHFIEAPPRRHSRFSRVWYLR